MAADRYSGPQNYMAVIKVVGIGGGGMNAVNRMVAARIRGVEFVAINTDAQALLMSDADIKLDFGREITRGLGAGADPEVGRAAAEAHRDELEDVLNGSDMVFITAGEGGGTGTGGAPVVAEAARNLGALTVAVVTRPFGFEGHRRSAQAEQGIAELREAVDAMIVIPNDRLLHVVDKSTSMVEAFTVADEVLKNGVAGIAELITKPGLINVDFADVKTVLADSGSAVLGIGRASGDSRGIQAAERAMNSPLLETSIEGARGVLLAFTGPMDMTLHEVSEAAQKIREHTENEAQIIFGAHPDEAMGDEVQMTVIAAGLDRTRTGTRGPLTSEATRGARLSSAQPAPEVDDMFDIPQFVEK